MDVPLTPRGIDQARRLQTTLASKLVDIQFVFTSPLTRALETCKIALPNLEHVTVDSLMETNTGEVSNLTFEQLHSFDSRYEFQGFYNDLSYPNGESIADVYSRMKQWIENTLLKLEIDENKYIAIVGHGGTVNCFLHYFLQIPLKHYPSFHIDNCSITEIKYYKSKSVVLIKNINQKS